MDAAYLSSFCPAVGKSFACLVKKGPAQYLRNTAAPWVYESKSIEGGRRKVAVAGGRKKKKPHTKKTTNQDMATQMALDEKKIKIGRVISLEPCPTKYLNTGLKDAFSYGAAVILDISRAGPQGRK